MKKRNFNIQLFAEEATADPATAAADQGNASVKEEEKPATAAEPEKKYSDADLDRIVKGKKAEWKKELEKEVEATKAAEREAAKLEKMDAQQKAEYKAAQLQKELDEYKRKDTLAEMSKTARKMLSDEGISVSDELLSMLVTTDAEKTKAAVDGFKKLFTETVESKVKDRLRGETPKAGTGAAAPVSEIEKRIKKYQ